MTEKINKNTRYQQNWNKFVYIVFLSVITALAVTAQTPNEPQNLEPNQTLEREITGAETHRYKFDLQKNEFFQVRVEQKGVDVSLQLLDSGGTTLATMDSPNGKEGPEILSFVADKANSFVLDVSGLYAKAEKGIYVISRIASRKATKNDKHWVETERLFVAVITARDAENQREIAVKKWEEALSGWKKLKDASLIQLLAQKAVQLKSLNAKINYDEAFKLFRIGTEESFKAAMPKFKEAGRLYLEIDDKNNAGKSFLGMGRISDRLEEKSEALKFYETALQLYKAAMNKGGEATTLNNIGLVYSSLTDNHKALDYFQKAFSLYKAANEKGGEALTLNNIGKAYNALNEKQKALDSYFKCLSIRQALGDKDGEATTFNNIGTVYNDLGDKQKALDYYFKALPIRKDIGDKGGEATTLNNIGAVYSSLGEKQKAFDYYIQVLPLYKTVGDKGGEAITLSNIMLVWIALHNFRLAAFYGKQSVNKFQRIRQNIVGLDKNIQKTYLKSIEKTYRFLANILIAQGRIAEAEEVLGMLKEEEFFEYLRRDDKAAKDLKKNIKLTPTEEEAFKRYEEIADEITRIGKEFGELEKESKKYPVGKFPRQAEMDELDAKLEDARKVFNKFLEDLDIRFRNSETKEKDARVAGISGTKALLDSLNQPRTVIISTIAGEDRLNLIVTTSKINRAHTVDIKAADLNKLIVEFREVVKNPAVDPRPLGRKLYDVLFPADLQKDLEGVDADTIVWSLDGTLRYAPISALWDGKQYLVERYSNVIITLASRDKIDKIPVARTNWTALGLGVSQKFENFDALKAVPQELCRVVDDKRKKSACLKLTGGKAGVFSGVNLSDDEFTFESFRLHLGRYPLVHIASHFSLNAGTESDSYLLLGGGKTSADRKLSISAVRERLDTKFIGTELLTLSACNTAMSAGENSSGAEIEGFGALAQEQGAKTVLASLWAVADDSTRDLMIELYTQLETNPEMGKAEALRKAQLNLIYGKYAASEAIKNRSSEIIDFNGATQPVFTKDANAPFAHPYFWSPFVLIGNWR